MTPCKVMQSNPVYLHHMGGLHKRSGCYGGEGYHENGEHKAYGSAELGAYHQLKKKYGVTVFKKIQNGDIWRELHEAQPQGKSRELIETYKRRG